jgi:uncharacterized protein (DUF1015 family)
MAAGNADSFLHVIRPEIDLDPGTPLHDETEYAKAAENFKLFRREGKLLRDERPAFYLYRQTMGEHVQTGWVGASAVSDYLEGRIRKHEFTRPDKERDRIRHAEAIGGCAGPVFLTYRGVPELKAMMSGTASVEPTFDVTYEDGVRHQLWVVSDVATCEQIRSMFEKIPATYIADGHHRAAASALAARTIEDGLEEPAGEEAPTKFFLTVLFPADQLEVLDYNRLVRDLNGMDPDDLVQRLTAAGFEVRADYRGERPRYPETFGMYLDGRWFLLIADSEMNRGPKASDKLDVALLTREVLQPLLGIGDPRTDQRIEFVGGIRGMDELKRRVDNGDHAVAFSLHPTPLKSVMEVADAGEVMPPKSTWFEPKLRSGLVTMTWEGEKL